MPEIDLAVFNQKAVPLLDEVKYFLFLYGSLVNGHSSVMQEPVALTIRRLNYGTIKIEL